MYYTQLLAATMKTQTFTHMGQNISLCAVIYIRTCAQWNLQIKDTLGKPLLSFVRRLSSLEESKSIGTMDSKHFGPQNVSSVERLSLFQSVHYQRFHGTYSNHHQYLHHYN